MSRHSLLALAVAILAAALDPHARAAGAELIRLEDFRRTPAVFEPRLSPSGDRIVALTPVEGRSAITVTPRSGGPSRRVYRDAVRTIDNIRWSADGRWLLYFQDAGGDENYHLFRLSPDGEGGKPTDLTPLNGAQAELIALPSKRPSVAVVTLNHRDPKLFDAYRVDLETGRLEEAARNNGQITGYFADGFGRVLLATTIKDDGVAEILSRPDEASPWRVIYTAPVAERLSVLKLHPHAPRAVVLTDRGSDKQRLNWLSLEDGSLSPLGPHRCGRYDATDVLLDDDGAELAQVCVELQAGLWPSTPVVKRAVQALGATGKAVTFASRTADAEQWIFYVDGAQDPGRYYQYDDRSGKAEVLYAARPWLDGKTLSPTKAAWIKARDGLPLLVYYTPPTYHKTAKTPLLVAVHGGPWSRDVGGFDGEAQTWANRGYGVLQVQFRGSTGLGTRHFEAGIHQHRLGMMNDLIDGIDWAAAHQGTSGPVCILGGSHGGFMVLTGLTRDPDRFACGVDYAGTIDMVSLVESFPAYWKPYLPARWYRFVGNPAIPADRARLEAMSPITYVDRARAPILVFQGANDPRVRKDQADTVARIFCERGLEVTYLLAKEEGHGFGNEETALGVYRAVELFLSRHLGGRAQPEVSPTAQKALDRMMADGALHPVNSSERPASTCKSTGGNAR